MTYKVFICHAYDHQEIYFDLVKKLNNSGLDWRNLSVQFDMRYGTSSEEVDTEELRERISKRIDESDVLIALTKPIASRRKWLQWEIKRAKEKGKPVIGIARKRNDNVSAFVRRHADDIVDTWRVDHIVNAIAGYGDEYRQCPRPEIEVQQPLPPLPSSTPDEELAAEPSPPAPDESDAPAITAVDPPFGELPRDVLFRDLGAVVPERVVGGHSLKRPRWWWPFGERRSGLRA